MCMCDIINTKCLIILLVFIKTLVLIWTNRGYFQEYKNYVKRIIDHIIVATSLICLCWFFAIVALAIKIDSRESIIFKQRRCLQWEKQKQI